MPQLLPALGVLHAPCSPSAHPAMAPALSTVLQGCLLEAQFTHHSLTAPNSQAIHLYPGRTLTTLATYPPQEQAGGLPNAKGAHGNTALHMAAAGGHTGCIKALLDTKASVDVHAADGCTPLHRAAAAGACVAQQGQCRGGRGSGAPGRACIGAGWAGVHVQLRCSQAFLPSCRQLLSPSSSPLPPLAGHGEACAALLAGGASPDAVTPKRVTPLLMACEAGHASAVAALMAGGASADAKNPAGATPAQLVRGWWGVGVLGCCWPGHRRENES